MLAQILKKYKLNLEESIENKRVWVWTKHAYNKDKVKKFH